MSLDVIAILIALVAALGFVLRAALIQRGKDKAKIKRQAETLDALTQRDKMAHEVRRESDEELLDRISPPDR